MEITLLDIALRLLCATLIGFAVGVEREWIHRPAGMRTHMVVAVGACVVIMTGEQIFLQSGQYGAWSDPDRMAAQVISGIGFLGAGTIIREGITIKGLTTAASLWAVASLGLAVGAGCYFIALCGTLIIVITLTVLRVLQDKQFRHTDNPRLLLHIPCSDPVLLTENLKRLAEDSGANILKLNFETLEGDRFTVHAELRLPGRQSSERLPQFLSLLRAMEQDASMQVTLI